MKANKHFKRNKNSWLRFAPLHIIANNFCPLKWALCMRPRILNDEIVTIIGSSYFEAISALLEKLDRHENRSSSGFQAGYYENGFAASICILSAVALESYVMRARYVNNAEGHNLDRKAVPDYLKGIYPEFPYVEEIKEIFVVRDLLAHNHLWKVELELSEEEGMKEKNGKRRSAGDKKYLFCVEDGAAKTNILGLNVNPIKVGAQDARATLKVMWNTLLFLEDKNRNQCYVSHLHVTHKGRQVQMGKLIGLEETCT